MSTRQKFFISLFLVPFLVGLSLPECHAAPVVLKLVTAWQSNYFETSNFLTVVDAVNKAAKGKFVIKYLGGPEVIPVRQLGESLRDGTVDMAYFAMSYTAGIEPAVQYGILSPFSPSQERENGTLNFWNKIYAKKLHAFCLGRYGWGKRFYFLFGKKKVTKPDFTGLRIRSSPVVDPIITKLGGARVGMSMGELYSAMDRGVIDGYATTLSGMRSLNLQEVTKYVLDEPFWHTETKAMINLSKWQSLSPDLRKLMVALFSKEEKPNVARVAEFSEHEKGKLKKAGLQFIKFTPADAKYFYRVVSEAGWEYARKQAPEYYAEFKKLFNQ